MSNGASLNGTGGASLMSNGGVSNIPDIITNQDFNFTNSNSSVRFCFDVFSLEIFCLDVFCLDIFCSYFVL